MSAVASDLPALTVNRQSGVTSASVRRRNYFQAQLIWLIIQVFLAGVCVWKYVLAHKGSCQVNLVIEKPQIITASLLFCLPFAFLLCLLSSMWCEMNINLYIQSMWAVGPVCQQTVSPRFLPQAQKPAICTGFCVCQPGLQRYACACVCALRACLVGRNMI